MFENFKFFLPMKNTFSLMTTSSVILKFWLVSDFSSFLVVLTGERSCTFAQYPNKFSLDKPSSSIEHYHLWLE